MKFYAMRNTHFSLTSLEFNCYGVRKGIHQVLLFIGRDTGLTRKGRGILNFYYNFVG